MAKRKVCEPEKPIVIQNGFEPRRWQRRAVDLCRTAAVNGSDRALIAACPGSGKTYGGLLIASELAHRAGKGPKIIVLTPNLAIKTQWIDRARVLSLELLPVKSGEDLRQDALALTETGFILSYQQAISLRHSLREFCEAHKPIIILDEVHHTEGPQTTKDGNAWGHVVTQSCAAASFKLCMTGTPFREGNNPIAFVDYDHDQRTAISLHEYSFADAIAEGVCRAIEFTLFDGHTAWIDKGETIRANFADKLTKKRSRQRLRAALSTDGDHPRTLLAAADAKLTELRKGSGVDAVAAGLVVACDTEHAEALAAELAAITGEKPLVVHNKIDDAQAQISAFRSSTAKWIIGINMLSEGVDIPRLRVGVYASNIRASLYFHQFCGRFARVMESRFERSYVFMPADSELEAIALEIERMRSHAIGEDYTGHLRRVGGGGGPRPDMEVLSSDGEAQTVAVSGMKLPFAYIQSHIGMANSFRAKDVSRKHLSDGEVVKIFIDLGVIPAPGATA